MPPDSRERLLLYAADSEIVKVAGLYSGIGGLELGFHRAKFEPDLLCEIDPICGDVLRKRFDGVRLVADVNEVANSSACGTF